MEIFKLIGSVMVDTADAEKSIQKTGDKAEGLGNKLVNGAKTAGKWAIGVAGAAASVGAAMIGVAKKSAEAADAIDKGAQRMEMSTDSYQELAYAAGMSGVEMSTLEAAAKKLEGTDLNMDDALKEIYSLETAEERAAKASELFGDSVAYKMTPLLNASAEDMAAMKQEAHDLGAVMSEDAVKSGAAMGDMFSKIDQTIQGLKTSLLTELMPYAMEILQWVVDKLPIIVRTVKKVMDAVMPLVKPVLDSLMKLIEGFCALLDGDIKGFFNGIIHFLGGITKSFLDIGANIFVALWDGLAGVWNDIANWVSDKVNWLIDKLAFWRRGSSEMEGGNAHAGGLPYVPYDNYPALLHRGESVMTAADSQGLLAAVQKIAENGGSGGDINITVQSVLDGRVIGESVTRYQTNKARAMA